MLPNVFNLFEKISKCFLFKKYILLDSCQTRHCLHFTKSKTFSFWSFQSVEKIKNFRNKKYIKLINGGGPNKSGGGGEGGGGRIFFQKKLSGGDVFSGPRSIGGSDEFCKKPISSKVLKTMVINGVTRSENIEISRNDSIQKCICVPFKRRFIVFPMLHSVKWIFEHYDVMFR